MGIIRGSEWRKWDLHIHTPESIVHDYKTSGSVDIWEKYIDELEKLPSDIKVIGINDYLFLDGYEKVIKYKSSGRLQNIDLILPVIEFRLKEFVGNSKLGRINYHIIFSNELDIETIKQQFLTQLYGNAKLDSASTSATWGGALSRQALIDLGKSIKKTTPSGTASPNGSDLEVGFNNINFELSKIEKLLKNQYLSNKYLTAIGKTEWDDFRWEGSTSDKKSLINGCDFVFIASKDADQAHKSKDKLVKDKVNSRVLHCSDGHEFYDGAYNSKVLGHCLTWIKADPTFEGLKQVVYEPESRVRLSDNRPQEPLYRLEQVKFGFDASVAWGNDMFCFADFGDPIVFSPYLTCIVGGRGSGKSTLLNLISEKIGVSGNFFSEVNVSNISSHIMFTPEIVPGIEFLAQNTIEKFATDSVAFTNAIYNRLNKKSNGQLKLKENSVVESLDGFDEQINLLQYRLVLRNEVLRLRKELKVNNNIVKTFTDEVYIYTKKALEKLQQDKSNLEQSRLGYKELYEGLKNLKDGKSVMADPKNNYDKYYNELFSEIEVLFEKYDTKDYVYDRELLENLNVEIAKKEKIIEEYFKVKGLSADNTKDAQYASQNIVRLKDELKNKLRDLVVIKRNIYKFTAIDIDDSIKIFEAEITFELEIINEIFKDIADKNPSEVKLIEVKYELNINALEKVFNDFENKLSIQGKISSFRKTFIEYISQVSLGDVLELKNSKDFIEKIGNKSTQAYKAIIEIFSDNTNFQIYKLLIEKEFRNIKDNKVLKVYYDEKPLDNSSFGQKCTAAIVILLSLGNNPVIIDEHEAHLDSSLIANYLVELIKQQKEQRQIIFATHNANFVLNADAELIIKLENNNGTTNVENFTIEDLAHRDDLLKLEGGKEAFMKRERKYNLLKAWNENTI